MTPSQRTAGAKSLSREKGEHGPFSQEETIKTEQLQIERKAFMFALKENPRGRFLRITEDVNGRRDSIIVPAPGLEDFKKTLEDMVRASEQTPSRVEKAGEGGSAVAAS